MLQNVNMHPFKSDTSENLVSISQSINQGFFFAYVHTRGVRIEYKWQLLIRTKYHSFTLLVSANHNTNRKMFFVNKNLLISAAFLVLALAVMAKGATTKASGPQEVQDRIIL